MLALAPRMVLSLVGYKNNVIVVVGQGVSAPTRHLQECLSALDRNVISQTRAYLVQNITPFQSLQFRNFACLFIASFEKFE